MRQVKIVYDKRCGTHDVHVTTNGRQWYVVHSDKHREGGIDIMLGFCAAGYQSVDDKK